HAPNRDDVRDVRNAKTVEEYRGTRCTREERAAISSGLGHQKEGTVVLPDRVSGGHRALKIGGTEKLRLRTGNKRRWNRGAPELGVRSRARHGLVGDTECCVQNSSRFVVYCAVAH